ncbi:MAG TPA: biopolymer transporter ExbD [Bacteroidales bacterium]|nr:biopolymer transporter ExbD [Bacteroidales bacterium]
MKRQIQEINASSMADIAFLLLIFFLVTTTMDVDSGITRLLPPPPDPNAPIPDINQRNVFVVLINAGDQLLIEGKPGNIKELRKLAKDFFENPNGDPNLSESEMLSDKIKKTPEGKQRDKLILAEKLLGDRPISKGIISLQNDRGTSYKMYLKVQNELAGAIDELRDKLAKEAFGISYNKLIELKQDDKVESIRTVIPMQISEAEPKDIGGRK